jgi:uncharacterized protein YukE
VPAVIIDPGFSGNVTPKVNGPSYEVKTAAVTNGSVTQYGADEIENFFATLDPGAASEAALGHTQVTKALNDAAGAISHRATALSTAWKGDGATSALSALQSIHTATTQLAKQSSQTAHALNTLAAQMSPFVGWTAPSVASLSQPTPQQQATLTAAKQNPTQANTTAAAGVTASIQSSAVQARNQAAQAKLTEFNGVLVSANNALPQSITVDPPKISHGSGTGTTSGSGAGSTGGGAATPPGSSPGPSGSPTPSPTPAPTPTPTPIKLTGGGPPPTTVTPPTGPSPVPTTGSGPGPTPDPTAPGIPTILPATPTSTSGDTLAPVTGTPAQDQGVVPADDPAVVGVDAPGIQSGLIGNPGGVGGFGTPVPGETIGTSGSFGNPGLGDSVGDGLAPDGVFGALPGDTAIMGSDGMIGAPGEPAGGFVGFPGGGAFGSDPGAGGSAVGRFGETTSFAGGESDGVVAGGGVTDGTISDTSVAADGAAGADAADGAFPMGGATGSGDKERDRYRQSWENEDADLWADRAAVTPALIGR